MKVQILTRNVELLKRLLESAKEKALTYKAFELAIHRLTGELEHTGIVKGKDWKYIHICYTDGGWNFFSDDQVPLEGDAITVLSKTIHVINTLFPKEEKLPEPWWDVSRNEAELLLKNQPPKTYFFRRGEFCLLLEKTLRDVHLKTVNCFALTYVEEVGKIAELTIVQCDAFWTFYNDDPSLERGERFGHLSELLASLKDRVQFPLKLEKN